jgi:hypothetical protein
VAKCRRHDHGYAAAIASVPIVSHSGLRAMAELRAIVSATTSGPIEAAPGRRKLIAVVHADMVGYSRQALHGTQANVFRFASELLNSIRFRHNSKRQVCNTFDPFSGPIVPPEPRPQFVLMV